MKLEHVGIAVHDAESASDVLSRLLERPRYKVETVSSEGVRTHFLDASNCRLEILESLEEGSPVAKFLEKRGDGVHHLAFEVDDVEKMMEHAVALGFQPLAERPGQGADDKRIFFLHPKETAGILIEFVQTDPNRLDPEMIESDGVELAVYRRGRSDAPSIVVLHGAASSTRSETAHLIKGLEPHFHVTAFDLPGHGSSGSIPEPFSMDSFAAPIRSAIQQIDLKAVHLVGFSMGAGAAMRLVEQEPDRFASLTLVSATDEWTEERVRRMRRRLDVRLIRRQRAIASLFEQIHGERWVDLLLALSRFIESLSGDRFADAYLARFNLPALLVSGDRDPLFGVEPALRLARDLPRARLCVLPSENHPFSATEISSIASVIRSFINDLPNTAAG